MPIFKDETVAKSIKNSEGSTVEIEKGKDCKKTKAVFNKRREDKIQRKEEKGARERPVSFVTLKKKEKGTEIACFYKDCQNSETFEKKKAHC